MKIKRNKRKMKTNKMKQNDEEEEKEEDLSWKGLGCSVMILQYYRIAFNESPKHSIHIYIYIYEKHHKGSYSFIQLF